MCPLLFNFASFATNWMEENFLPKLVFYLPFCLVFSNGLFVWIKMHEN